VAAGLFVVALLLRLPFRVDSLWAHDSVLYARAVVAFDPADDRPHPPGYLWYVLLVRAVTGLTGDVNDAMTLISAVAGAAAVSLLYLFAARLYDERTARIAAILLMTSVTFWGESAVAYPYTVLAALATLVALLLWRSIGSGRALVAASIAWGIVVGFRTDLAVMLAPLWLIAASSVPLAWAAAGALAFAGPAGAWVAASAALTSGGLSEFVGEGVDQGLSMGQRHGVLGAGPSALWTNARELARNLGRGTYLMAPLLVGVAASRRVLRAETRFPRRAAFLLAWALTPISAFVLVHIGEYGHVFSALPAICVIAARGVIGLARTAHMPMLVPWIAGAAALGNAGIFLFSDTPLSAVDLARRDSGIAQKVAFIREHIGSERSVVITAYDQLIIEHYLPGQRYVQYEPDMTPTLARRLPCLEDCSRPLTVVIWDDLLRPVGQWRTFRAVGGAVLRTTEARPGATLRIRGRHLVAIDDN
jgi:hypothetical protein